MKYKPYIVFGSTLIIAIFSLFFAGYIFLSLEIPFLGRNGILNGLWLDLAFLTVLYRRLNKEIKK